MTETNSVKNLSIGQLSKATGCKVPTIRYYEDIGLMPPPARSEGNQRLYGQRELDRLSFIRHSRELGFSQAAIRELLQMTDAPERPCENADRIAQQQLEAVERKIARLEVLRHELARMVKQCDGGRIADCRVIEVLADHNECRAEHH